MDRTSGVEHTAAALSRLESHARRGALAVLLCLPVWPVSAQQTDSTPSGMVAYFMTSGVGCPREWSAPANAQGRVLVGFSDPAAIGATVRSPMLPQTAPVHSHTFTTTVTLDQK